MAYNMLKSMAEEGKENWTSAVRDLLCTNGFAFAWWNGSVRDEIRFLAEFQQRLKDCFIQIGIRSWNLVGDTIKYTELLKVL